jgi:hypothetical protein
MSVGLADHSSEPCAHCIFINRHQLLPGFPGLDSMVYIKLFFRSCSSQSASCASLNLASSALI